MARGGSWRDSIVVQPYRKEVRYGGFESPRVLNDVRTEKRRRAAERKSGKGSSGSSGDSGRPKSVQDAIDSLNVSPEVREAIRNETGGGKGNKQSIWSKAIGGAGDVLERGLDAIDTPRAFLTALGSEAGEEVASWINDDEKDAENRKKGIDGFSWRDVLDQTWGNESLVEQTETDQSKFFKDRGVTYDPKTGRTSGGNWQTFGIGVAGDIATDPLTYVSGAGALDDPAKVSRRLLTEGTGELGEQGAKEAAAKVLKNRGASILSDNELAAIGERGGIYMKTPGSGTVGRALKIDRVYKRLGIPTEAEVVSRKSLLGRGATGTARVARKPLNWGLDKATPLTKLGLSGGSPMLRANLRSGDPERAADALWTLTFQGEGRGVRKAFEGEYSARVRKLLHQGKKDGVSGRDMWLAQGGDAEAIAAVERKSPGLAGEFNAVFDDMATDANRRAGSDFIKSRDQYTPRFLTDEARARVVGGGAQGTPSKGMGSAASRRKYGTGVGDVDEVLGHKLIPQAEHPRGWSEERQIDEIFKLEGMGSSGAGWYKDDANEAFPTYVQVLAKQLEREYTAGKLKSVGVGADLRGTRITDESRKAVAKSMRAERGLARAKRARRAAERASTSVADELGETARSAERLVDEQSNLFTAAEAIDEFRQTYDAAAQVQADSLTKLLDEAREEAQLLSGERAVAREQFEESTRILGELNNRMKRLLDHRDELTLKQARTWEAAGQRIERAEANYAELDAIRAQLDDVDELLGEVNQPLEELLAEELDIKRQLADLNQRIPELYGQGQDELADTLATARESLEQRARLLRRESSLAQEGRDFFTEGRQEILDRLGSAAEELRAAGLDQQADEYVRLQRNMPKPLDDLPPQYHGGQLPTGQLGTVDQSGADNLLGPGLYTTANETAASAYGDVSQVAWTPERPPNIAQFDGPVTPELEAVFQRVAGDFGLPLQPALTAEQTYYDLMDLAIDAGAYEDVQLAFRDRMLEAGYDAITHLDGGRQAQTEPLHRATLWLDPTNMAAFPKGQEGLAPGHGGVWNFSTEQAGRLGRTGKDAASFDAFLGPQVTDSLDLGNGTMQFQWRAVNPKVSTPEQNLVLDGIEEAVQQGLIDSEDLQRALSEFANAPEGARAVALENALTPSQKQLAAEALRDRLIANGYDGLLVPNGDSWTAIALDPATLKRADGTSMPNAFWQKQQELMMLMGQNPAVEAQLDVTERAIQHLGANTNDAAELQLRNRQRLQELERNLASREATTSAAAQQVYEREHALRMRAEEVREEAAQVLAQAQALEPQIQKTVAQVATLEAKALQAEADLLRAGKRELTWAETAKRLRGSKLQEETFKHAIRDGMRTFGVNSMLPEQVVEALTASTRLNEPDSLRKFLRFHDRALGQLKSYMVFSPGFHSRNFMGGVFNNWLGGVAEESYGKYAKAAFYSQVGKLDQLDPALADAYRAAQSHGILTGGQTAGEIENRVGRRLSVNPLSQDFIPLRGSRRAGESVENTLRGTMFIDEYLKNGGNATEAVQKVYKFHFDYDDLSPFEASVVRRVIPFYVWTRRNVPLMLDQMAKNPAKIGRYFTIKRHMEKLSEEEGIVPQYFEDGWAIRTPWKIGGSRVYGMPDLPITSLVDVTDPGQALGQISPFIKAPYEYFAGKQVWKGIPLKSDYEELPGAWGWLEGPLRAIGQVRDGADGQPMIRQDRAYFLQQFLPSLGVARRLAPTEDKYKDRQLTSWLSWGLGLGARANTDDEQKNEIFRRYFALKDDIDAYKSLGYDEDVAELLGAR